MIEIPGGWYVGTTVEALHGTDDGIQEVTITVQRAGEDKLSAITYKVDR
jgi:hypothetical protein